MDGNETRAENAQARSPPAVEGPPELERRDRQVQISAKQRETHGVPRLVEGGDLFDAHTMKLSAIASTR